MTDSSGSLPPELRAFLFSCIDSLEQVELLVALARSGAVRTVREMGTELGLAESSTRRHLETLQARGLLTVKVGDEMVYRYEPKTPELARYTGLLLGHYDAARLDVLTFVNTQSRTALKQFSDAFKLRDEDRDRE
jgi:DNA-binding transcriptional ArsR family regulator